MDTENLRRVIDTWTEQHLYRQYINHHSGTKRYETCASRESQVLFWNEIQSRG